MSRKITLAFLKTEAASGITLALAAVLAILLANSPWAASYFSLIKHPLTFQAGDFEITKPVLKWIKDGLMTIFFFVVGLEIKYEILRGELSNPRKLALPVLGALGGMVVPAVVYLAFNLGPGGALEGWPTPVATDIAFALAALAIAGPRLPMALRTFLLTLAIADDLGAVVCSPSWPWPVAGGARPTGSSPSWPFLSGPSPWKAGSTPPLRGSQRP